jgi:hypothetical protein
MTAEQGVAERLMRPARTLVVEDLAAGWFTGRVRLLVEDFAAPVSPIQLAGRGRWEPHCGPAPRPRPERAGPVPGSRLQRSTSCSAPRAASPLRWRSQSPMSSRLSGTDPLSWSSWR